MPATREAERVVKRCCRCKNTKPAEAFYRDGSNTDGIKSYCKDCAREEARTRNDRDPQACVEKCRRWYAENPEKAREASRQYYARNAERCRIQSALRYAVKCGKVTRQPCEQCGATPAHGHHDDYGKPFDVRWLCQPCHLRLHRDERDAERERSTFTEEKDHAITRQ